MGCQMCGRPVVETPMLTSHVIDQSSSYHAEPSNDPNYGTQALVELLRLGLGLRSSFRTELSGPQWEAVWRQLAAHRLSGVVWPVIKDTPGLPQRMTDWFVHTRDTTSRLGAANLLTMRRVMPLMNAAGIPALAFKGPVLQQLAYGSIFHRPSTDLDVLVSYRDFDRAGGLLANAGFKLAPVCRSPWWKLSLGEQHFLASGPTGVTVDLHHRVQQPGCPLPLEPDRFFEQKMAVEIGGQTVPTLSLRHSVLLAAMSYAKALHHRESAARYLVDMVSLTKRHPQLQWRQIDDEAQTQGLSNTLALAVRGCVALLGNDSLPATESTRLLTEVTDEDLVKMTLSPQDPTLHWPRRRALLYTLYDRKLRYPGGLVSMVGSDLLRRLASPAARLGLAGTATS